MGDCAKMQVLYGNVGLSIHPHRKDQISKDMLSWFPLFFPFKVGHLSPREPRPILTKRPLCRSHCTYQVARNCRFRYGG